MILSHHLSAQLTDPTRGCRSGRLCAACCLVLVQVSLLPADVAFCQPNEEKTGFHFEDSGDQSLKVLDGERPVLVYNFGPIMKRTGPAAVDSRSSYVHPMYGLDGEVLTDDFPKDHYHHHGLFWGWPHVTIGEKHFDFWKMRGTDIKFKQWLAKKVDNDIATLRVENEWIANNKAVVREEATLQVYPVSDNGRLINVQLTWTALEKPITLGGAAGKSYGGVSLRFAPREDTVVTVPGGPATQDLLATRLPWADLSAKFQGTTATSGAALFVDPCHPNFPPEWMTRAYGLLAVGWPGVKPQTIERGKSIICNYGVWIHRGRVDAAKIQTVYEAFSLRSGGRQ